MRQKPVRNRRRHAALVSVDLTLATAIHDATIEIEPASLGVDAPAHAEIRFVPSLTESECRSVCRQESYS
jgi:hypothetical protein